MAATPHPLLLGALVLAGCAGVGPGRPLETYLADGRLPAGAPVVLVDLDDTVYERDTDLPMVGASDALRDLARDHLVVYLTARPTHAKLPGVTLNRGDSEEFITANGFPDGPLFTSSFWWWTTRGQRGGKLASFAQLREFGIDRIALAVGDRPHDLEVYLENGLVPVDRAVIILIEDGERSDPDREDLPEDAIARAIPGSGPAWPRILAAYRNGELREGGAWIASQPPR